MSGLEIVGAAASVAGLLKFVEVISRVGGDIIHARKEKQQFRIILGDLQAQLGALQDLQQDAQGYPEQLYFLSLFQQRQGSPLKSGDQRGALLGIARAMKRMEHKLRERSTLKRRVLQLRWTLDKEEVKELMSEIREWQSQIQLVMQQDQLKLTMKILTLGKDTNSVVRNIDTVTGETRDVTQGIASTTDRTADQTQRIETVTVETHSATQGIAQTSESIAERTQRIENATAKTQSVTQGVATATDTIAERTRRIEQLESSIQADSLALRLRKETKDKKELHETIADWLSRLDFNARHSEIYNGSIDISKEFTESPEFQAWRSGRPWILFCWADAGAGKTMLSSLIVEHLRTRPEAPRMPVLCMYLNHKEHDTQNPRTLIGSLLKQIVQYNDYDFCSEDLVRKYKGKAKGTSLSRKELQEAFCSEIMHYERVFVVVDALDESSSDVQKLYADLLRQRRIPLGRLCVMITSREPPPDAVKGITCDACDAGPFNLFFRCRDCTEPFDVCYNCKAKQKNCGKPGHTLIEAYEGTEVYKHINPSENVIREYVKNEIHGEIQTYRPGRAELGLYTSQPGTTLLGRLCQKDPKLEETIVEKICARADGKFLLAKLYVETLRVKLKKREIDDALRELPRGYTGVYESAMERIKAYSVNEPRSSATSLAITTLTWVVHTHRPLNLAELQHALAINLDTAFSDDDIYDEEELLTKTAGLLILGDNRDVRVSHYTVQEYFMDQGKEWLLKDADKLIARACLHYLSSDDLSTPCNNSQEDEQFEGRQKRWPFMRYAYEYWGTHAMDASPDPETSADALKFLRDPSRVATLVEASWYLKSAEAAKWEIRKGANALHIAAWFGLTDVLSELVDEGLDINAKDPFHLQTPLIYASRRGHSDTVAKLVELGAAINSRSARGHTALVEAVIEGHLSVVKVLLKRYDLDVNRILPWDFGRSVVMLAVISNNLEIVAALLGRQDISINQGDSKGYTALMLASSFGFVNIVERLLAQPDIDVNVTSRYGTSALFHAAACEDTDIGKDIAELLLDHGINTSVSDRQGGGTALIRAVDCGNRAVVELLLDRNVDIRQTDDQGRGLLHAAAIYDRREVATFVIGRGLPVNVRDKQDRTPLHDASRSGSVAMIELLLERDADALLKDSSGRTPARVAWENGRSIALELLKKKSVQEGDKVGSTMFDEEQLPVWSLAKLGREDIIQRRIAERSRDLFSLSHLDPDTDDTPVHCAVGAEQPSILRLLLSAGLSPDTQNARFRSPLHQAVLSSNIALTQILLEAYPNLNPRDETGTTPLFLAYTSDRLQNALLLVEAGAVIDEKALILPLFFAAIDYERLVAVKVLMKKHKAPILAKNKRGESALQIAKARGLIEIQRLLDGNKSYANNRSLAIDEDEGLDLNASVKGYFTRPEVWKEEEEDEKEKEKEKEEKELRSEDFPAVPTGEVKDDSPSKRREASMAASRR